MIANKTLAQSIHCPVEVLSEDSQGILRIAVDDPSLPEIDDPSLPQISDREERLVLTFNKPVMDLSPLLQASSYSLTGGHRIFPRILHADQFPSDDKRVILTLDKVGDFSIYTLTVNDSDIAPAFASGKLRFRVACDDPFDCRSTELQANSTPDLAVAIDYLVKDYAGFRQALLEFIPTRMPAWTERSEADLGMMIMELFASTADTLSYMQDRVANEAFLDTASQRRSVAGHLALIDYEMDQGASAFTWLHFKVANEQSLPVDKGLSVCTKRGRVKEQVVLFETHGDLTLRPEHNEMSVYTGGKVDCCLHSDASSLTLVGSYPFLQVGEHVLLDDGQGQRDIVRLTHVSIEANKTVIGWSNRTPLRYRYCVQAFDDKTIFGVLRSVNRCDETLSVSIKMDGVHLTEKTLPLAPGAEIVIDGKVDNSANLKAPCNLRLRLSQCQEWIERVVVQSPPDLMVYGNLVPATHGETIVDEKVVPNDTKEVDFNRLLDRGIRLSRAPLAYLHPDTPGLPISSIMPDSLPRRKPRNISTLTMKVDDIPWQERSTLLDSGSNDTHFRVEIDDVGDATIRFAKRFDNKDSEFGARPKYSAKTKISASYRVGGGGVGNVAADTLVQVQPPGMAQSLGIQMVTNPLPAVGGRDLESRDHARRFAPATFKKSLVALTAADFQEAAQGYRDADGVQVIQRVQAAFRWTGSWLTATLAVDPVGTTKLPSEREKELLAFLDSRRLAGYDVEVTGKPNFVPVELVIEICLKPAFRADKIETRIRQVLGTAELSGGGVGFFHPDNFTFGQSLYVSRIFDAIGTVEGVRASRIVRLCRYRAANFNSQTVDNLKQGFLKVGPEEIIRLDNDRNFPENGTLLLLIHESGAIQ